MLENAVNNQRFHDQQRVFEIGNVYHRRDDDLPDEPRRLAILMTGNRAGEVWMGDNPNGQIDFYDIKGTVEGLLKGLHIDNGAYERAQHPSFHPGRSAALTINDAHIGVFGELHPVVARAAGLNNAPAMAAEFNLDKLLKYAKPDHETTSLPITPAIIEDIALVVAQDIPSAEVEELIHRAGGHLVKDVSLFDVYEGGSIAAGKKSLAYRIVYQTDERTLKDKDVAKVRKRIISTAEKQLNAKLRA